MTLFIVSTSAVQLNHVLSSAVKKVSFLYLMHEANKTYLLIASLKTIAKDHHKTPLLPLFILLSYQKNGFQD